METGPTVHPDDELPEDPHDDRIPRVDTAVRAVLTLLMAVIWGLVETALAAIVIFGVVFTLVVQQPPPTRLRRLSNRLVCYAYRLWRYMTYNEATVPFPFSDFPEEIEPTRELEWDDARDIRELFELIRRDDPER